MERGNEPPGGSDPTGGEESDPSDTSEPTHGDPGPAPSGGGPSSVAGGGGSSGATDSGEEYDLDMVDFDQVEYLDDGSIKAPILDDDGNIVNWVHAENIGSNEVANSPIKPGETRFFDIGGRSAQMNDDGTIEFLD